MGGGKDVAIGLAKADDGVGLKESVNSSHCGLHYFVFAPRKGQIAGEGVKRDGPLFPLAYRPLLCPGARCQDSCHACQAKVHGEHEAVFKPGNGKGKNLRNEKEIPPECAQSSREDDGTDAETEGQERYRQEKDQGNGLISHQSRQRERGQFDGRDNPGCRQILGKTGLKSRENHARFLFRAVFLSSDDVDVQVAALLHHSAEQFPLASECALPRLSQEDLCAVLLTRDAENRLADVLIRRRDDLCAEFPGHRDVLRQILLLVFRKSP